LSEVARVERVKGPYRIKHYNFLRSVTVSSDVMPEKITSMALNAKAREIVEDLRKRYREVNSVFGGEEEHFKESVSSLRSAMRLSVFGIFAILVFLFRNYLHSLLILSCVPLGLIGVNA